MFYVRAFARRSLQLSLQFVAAVRRCSSQLLVSKPPHSPRYVAYVLYGTVSKPPHSPRSLLYVLYVLYGIETRVKYTICATQCIFGTCSNAICIVYSSVGLRYRIAHIVHTWDHPT